MTQATASNTTPGGADLPDNWRADASTFGARLALVRQRLGWGNVKEAAVACGLPAESWRTWERDGTTPRDTAAVARKIADRTRCDYLWLVLGVDAPERAA